MSLAQKNCTPSKKGDSPLTKELTNDLLRQIDSDWSLTPDYAKLKRTFKFRNFSGAMKLAVIVGDIAENENHHPDLHISWGALTVTITTHDIKGLAESDFILCAKIDSAFNQFSKLL